jgi:hypothetical protein
MSKKIFNPADWQNKNQGNLENHNKIKVQTNSPLSQKSLQSFCSNNDIETITQRIETTATDIAPTYADWRDLGFALADALGESGRNYYHRLSRFYSGYTENETNKQYDNCLKAHGHGVTIKTLYHLAKTAGVDIAIFPNCQNGNLEIWKYWKFRPKSPLSHLSPNLKPKTCRKIPRKRPLSPK